MKNGGQIRMEEIARGLYGGSEEYDSFVEKFKPKRTTDDCFTPDNIYDAVADWVSEEYGIERGKMLRPFYPGGDYEHQEYPEDCAVVDNPPFSILSQIIKFYDANGVKYFLFAPGLTVFSSAQQNCAVLVDISIRYANGAEVSTSFVTNMDDLVARTAPKLQDALEEANKENIRERVKTLPRYDLPQEVITAARVKKMSRGGVDFRVRKEEAFFVRALDMQQKKKKALFGAGYIISSQAAERLAAAERAAAERAAAERAAAERAAAERADAIRWELSDRERKIIAQMDALTEDLKRGDET